MGYDSMSTSTISAGWETYADWIRSKMTKKATTNVDEVVAKPWTYGWTDVPLVLEQSSATSQEQEVTGAETQDRKNSSEQTRRGSSIGFSWAAAADSDEDVDFGDEQDTTPSPMSSSASSSSSLSAMTTTSTPDRPHTTGKHINFSSVEIREYAVVVGDHPFCKDGLPLSLDWRYSEESTVVDLKLYEMTRGSRYWNKPKRLTFLQRKLRLKRVSGLTEAELNATTERKARIPTVEDFFFDWGGADDSTIPEEKKQQSEEEKSLRHVPSLTDLKEYAVSV